MRTGPPLYPLVRLLPRAMTSRAAGWLARVRMPGALGRLLLRAYVRCSGIDMSEAEHELHHYRTIEEVFTRRLKAGKRSSEGVFCSPVDGVLSGSTAVEPDTMLNVKQLGYFVGELVNGHNWQSGSDGQEQPAWALTCYLSPRNYHRVHAPVSGTVVAIRYIPGDLWPVNGPFLRLLPDIYTRNERLVFRIALASGGHIDVVLVGALNVGRISTPLLGNFVTNASRRRQAFTVSCSHAIGVGDELGTFMLGSTVVIVCDRTVAERFSFATGERELRVGQALTVGD